MGGKVFSFLGVFWAVMLMTVCVSYAGTISIASVDSNGNQGNNQSSYSSISNDGRYIAFQSRANNLVPDDTNGRIDVFVHDNETGVTERVSVDSYGNQGIYDSLDAAISGDGRYVVFYSWNTFVANDTNNAIDVFVRDRETGVTERVSVDSYGNEANGNSVTPGTLSSDGRYVAFYSSASNLVPNDTNGVADIFIHDRVTGVTVRASVDSYGNEANNLSADPNISGNGRYVTFESRASNLVANDTNGKEDIFIHDLDTGATERVSVRSNGAQANNFSGLASRNTISYDGRYVIFWSDASNLVDSDTNGTTDVFVRDLVAGITERVSVNSAGIQGNGASAGPSVSGDGKYVVFTSGASNLVPDDANGEWDVFIHDRVTGVTELINVDSNGLQANNQSSYPTITPDGRFVVFESWATNLITEGTNGTLHIFVSNRDADSDGFFDSVDCDDNDDTIYPGAPEIKHDDIDQDCNGYDLTIDIVTATYKTNKDQLTVEATSALGASADLELVNYGPMAWDSRKLWWALVVEPAGGNPGTVTVSGPEGSESAPVQ